MISKLFFAGKVEKLEDTLIYEEDFVIFYLTLYLFNKNKFDLEEVKNLLFNFYSQKDVKDNGIFNFCMENFLYEGKFFKLNNNEKDINLFRETIAFMQEIDDKEFIDIEKIYYELEVNVDKEEIPYIEKLKKCLFIYYWKPNMDIKTKMIMAYSFYKDNKYFYKNYRLIDNKISKISDIFNSVEIIDLNIEDYQVSLLLYNNIYTLKNLKRMSVKTLMCVFGNNIDKFLNELTQYTYTIKNIEEMMLEDYDEIVKNEWKIAFKERNSIWEKRKTLAEIGEKLNITRERVRQIENKWIEKISKIQNKYKKIIKCLYRNINSNENNFIVVDDLENYIHNEQVLLFLIIILELGRTGIKYDNNYKIIFDEKQNSLEGLMQEQREKLEDIIPADEIRTPNALQSKILEKEYRLYQNKIWVKRTINVSEIYINELGNSFINGYDIGNDEDYNKFVEKIKSKYGEIEIPSSRAIVGLITRSNFIQINKATYTAREYAIKLNEAFVEEIIDFVLQNGPIVAYSLIYEKFKKKLDKIGVDNRYYLKGLLDEKLPKEFNTGRDFINTNSEKITSVFEVGKEIFKSFPGEFSIDDLREKMPGLQKGNYENYARIEEKNGLIRLGTKRFIYFDKLNINNEIIKELKLYIEQLFKQLNSNVITSKKIYSSLNFLNKELLSKLNIKSQYGDFALFSIIQYLYKDYYYNRPYISLEENEISTYSLIKDYALSLEKINYNKIKEYIQKMNMGGLYSYLNFIEDISDEYIQISVDELIRKEKFNISDEDLEKIHNLLEQVLKRGSLKTENFDGYFMLPKLGKSWNQYLLVGIIRTYFKNEYIVENTDKFYDSTNFIVRRIENGGKK